MSVCELEGPELDAAVARVIGVEPGAAYSSDWGLGGPLIEQYHIEISVPETTCHRRGGATPGWGECGFWTATSWKTRTKDGHRALGFHETSPLVAAMRVLASCSV